MVNMTNVTEALTIYDQLVAINHVSGGLLGVMLMLTIGIITFIVFKQRENDTKEVLLFTSTIMIVVGIMLMWSNMIGFKIMILPIIGLVTSISLIALTD